MKCWIRGDISGVPVSSGRIRRVKVWRWFGYEAVRALVFSPEMGSLVIMMSRDSSWGWDTQPDIHHTITYIKETIRVLVRPNLENELNLSLINTNGIPKN